MFRTIRSIRALTKPRFIRHKELLGKSEEELKEYYWRVADKFVNYELREGDRNEDSRYREYVGSSTAHFVIGYVSGTIIFYTVAYALYFWLLGRLFCHH